MEKDTWDVSMRKIGFTFIQCFNSLIQAFNCIIILCGYDLSRFLCIALLIFSAQNVTYD